MKTTSAQFAVSVFQNANVSVNAFGQVNAVAVTNSGSGYLGSIMGSHMKGPATPHKVIPPSHHHWQIEYIPAHMIWNKFRYQKECWRLWHWLSYSDGREDDGMHDVYNKTRRDFPTETEARSVMVLEQFEV